VETSDAPLIRVVIDTAKQISAAFETAVARGEISLDQLMDEKYREIAGTDPKQYMTEYVTFTDRILPPIQGTLHLLGIDYEVYRLFAAGVALVSTFVAGIALFVQGTTSQPFPPRLQSMFAPIFERWNTMGASWITLALIVSIASAKLSMRFATRKTRIVDRANAMAHSWLK